MCFAHAVVGDARPHRNAEPDELEDALGALPLPEVGELVAADDEDRVVERSRLERVDRASVRIELDVDSGRSSNASRASSRRDSGDAIVSLWPGSATTRTSSLSRPSSLDRRARQGDVADVRRIEGAAEDSYCHSSASPSSSTSAPRLTPARRSASSSSCCGRRRADDAVAAIGAQDPEPRAAPRLRPVLEELGKRLLHRPAPRSPAGRARRARASARRCPRRSRTTWRRPARCARRARRSSARARAGRSCSERRAEAVRRGPRRTRRARGRSSRNRPSRSSSDASSTCTSSRARSRCARNSWPRPAPSAAPSMSPGTSATVSCRSSGPSTVPRTGSMVVNG